MKIRISDMLDGLPPTEVRVEERTDADREKLRELTLMKVRAARRPVRKLPRCAVIAAVMAACMLCTVTVFAYVRWSGFALTGGMSRAEQQALLMDDTGYAMESIDPDGTVHYLDAQGRERFALSAEEVLAFEQNRERAREQAVQQSTDLLDVTTLTLIPQSVTQLPVGEDGILQDFMLGNGHLVLLHPEGADGYSLRKGDQVTLRLDANDACILEFSMSLDGSTVESQTAKAQQHVHTFTIPQDGAYCFSIMYYSSDKSAFTNASLTIE